MKWMFYTSGEDCRLARQEIKSLGNPDRTRNFGRIVIAESGKFDFSRLAMTLQVSRFLFEANTENLIDKIQNYNWPAVCRGSFAVRVKNVSSKDTKLFSSMERKLAELIWKKAGHPKANLRNPDVQINFYFFGCRVFCGILCTALYRNFESRKPHKRPGFHPTSLNPKIAAAMVNIAGAKKAVWDPFCGTGGILIEAGIMGIKPVGSDIDKKMLEFARKNIEFYGIKNYLLFECDAANVKSDENVICGNTSKKTKRAILKAIKNVDAIVCDMPYGKGSKVNDKNLSRFYSVFIKNALSLVGRGHVAVMVPANIRIQMKLIGLKPVFETKIYVHKSLTRRLMLF